VLCTFWLAQALALAGQPERARHVFERAISYINDVGLLAEEVDPATAELLGNFPQAFSPHRAHQRRLGHLRGRAPAGSQLGD
jgi:alpha,alpha-trehalase